MKSRFSAYLSSLITVSMMAALPVILNPQAASSQSSQSNCVRTPEAYIPPQTLAMIAYRGAFKEEGIPSYNVLVTEYKAGNITAEKIVDAAVMGCVLSNKYGVADHDNYVEDLKGAIQDLLQGDQD